MYVNINNIPKKVETIRTCLGRRLWKYSERNICSLYFVLVFSIYAMALELYLS